MLQPIAKRKLARFRELVESIKLTSVPGASQHKFSYSPHLTAWRGHEEVGYSFLQVPAQKLGALVSEFLSYLRQENLRLGEQLSTLLSPTECIYSDYFRVYLKDETRHPSGSFKDRQTVFLMLLAKAFDVPGVEIISCGNAAISAAFGVEFLKCL